MSIFLRNGFLLLMSCCWFASVQAYTVSGTINMKGDWQNQIYLATIDKLDDYYNASAASIINAGFIDENGYFLLEGKNLPEQPQYYRLYLIKEEHSEFNACLFVGGEEHNFIHLLLDNETEVHIEHGPDAYAPFGDYTIEGDPANLCMKSLSAIVYPSYIFYEIKFPSALQFSEDKLNRDLFVFADTCRHDLVALAALNNTDYDKYFESEYNHYRRMSTRLENTLSNHPYSQDYLRKMRYYSDSDISSAPILSWVITTLLGLALMALFFQNRQLKNQLNQSVQVSPKKAPMFTRQELKILELIKAGNTNKEIASILFIELSTVKSHINKLYTKMGVKNRSEAMQLAKSYE